MKRSIRISVTIATIVAIIWYMGSLKELKNVLFGAALNYLLLAFLIATIDRTMMSFKWGILLSFHGIRFPFLKNLQIYCASMVWGVFLPSTLGADAIRAYLTSRVTSHTNEIIASIVVERMIGFLVSLLVGLIGLGILSASGKVDIRFYPVLIGAGLTFVIGTAFFAISFNRTLFNKVYVNLPRRLRQLNIVNRLRELHDVYISYRANLLLIGIFSALTFTEQLLTIVFAWVIALSLNVDISLIYIAGVIPLTILIARLPISIDGIGVFEGIFVLLMSLAGVPAAEAVSIAILGRIIQTLAWLPWWATYSLKSGTFSPPVVEKP